MVRVPASVSSGLADGAGTSCGPSHALEVLHAVADPRDEVRDRVSIEYPDVLVLANIKTS